MAAATVRATVLQAEGKVLGFPRCPTSARMAVPPGIGEADRLLLDRLRWLALRSLIAPKPDFERACFLLAGQTDVSLDRFANAFFRGIAGKARRPMELYRPGTRGVSDDEIWLLRLVSAFRHQEEAGVRALVAWRIRPESQRWLRFLLAGMVRMLDDRS